MRCVALKGKKEFEVRSLKEPKSVKGSVTFKVKRAGICGSDIHYWVGGGPVGLVMGHEFCGVVTDPGNRKDLKVGDRITALPISPCGKCPACLSGNPQYCPSTWSEAVGLSLTNPGAYAEHSSCRSDLVIKVPGSLSDAEVAMVEPCAVGLHAVNLADIKIGDKVLVIGAGIIGDFCAELAKLNGAGYVAVSEANEKRGKKAVKLGCADEYFNALDKDFMTKARKKCPYGYDVVIDCCGNGPAVTSALMMARPNGTVVLVGVSNDPITIPTVVGVLNELVIKGAIAYTVDEFKQCIDLMCSKRIDVKKFVDDTVGLSKVQEAYERLTCGTDDAIKILIDPSKK